MLFWIQYTTQYMHEQSNIILLNSCFCVHFYCLIDKIISFSILIYVIPDHNTSNWFIIYKMFFIIHSYSFLNYEVVWLSTTTHPIDLLCLLFTFKHMYYICMYNTIAQDLLYEKFAHMGFLLPFNNNKHPAVLRCWATRISRSQISPSCGPPVCGFFWNDEYTNAILKWCANWCTVFFFYPINFIT